MPSFSERIALFRIQQYLAKHRPYVALVVGTYGRTLAAQALLFAIGCHRHVRMVFEPKKEENSDLSEIEPDTVIHELALERPGHLPYIASRILPRLLVIPHIGTEHIDLFGSKDMIAHEYLEVAHTLATDAVVVLNADDEHVRGLKEHIAHPVITYGMHADADIRLTRATRHGQLRGIFLEFILHDVHYEAHFPHLISKQHVAGALAGLAGAHAIGINMKDAIAAMRALQPPRGSFSLMQGINGSSVIDDSADACPEKLESSLKSFATLQSDIRKFVVLGDLENLSQYSIKAHEELGKQVSSVAPIIIFVGDMMRHAQAVALKTGIKVDTHHFKTSADAAAWLPDHIRQGDLIYISGGKSIQMENIIDRLTKGS